MASKATAEGDKTTNQRSLQIVGRCPTKGPLADSGQHGETLRDIAWSENVSHKTVSKPVLVLAVALPSGPDGVRIEIEEHRDE